MIELLAQAKHDMLAAAGFVTRADFEGAWNDAWELMVTERSWPHATEHRRQWRVAMLATRSEMRAAFLGQHTMFGDLASSLMAASARVRQIELTPEELPQVIIGAIQAGYGVTVPEQNETKEAALL
jgi:hypothetical protein